MPDVVLKKINPLSLGKIQAFVMGILALIVSLLTLIASVLVPALKVGIVFTILMPILYAIGGFISGLITAVVYNIAAKGAGGLVLDMEEK